MATKKKVTAPTIEAAANEEIVVATENAIEALVEATEEQTLEAATEALEETTSALVEEAKKRVRNYQQTAISLEDHLRLNAIKARWKETLNLTVSNAEIITAALDCLSHDTNLEAFMKQLVTAADQKQRAKDVKKFEELKAKLEA